MLNYLDIFTEKHVILFCRPNFLILLSSIGFEAKWQFSDEIFECLINPGSNVKSEGITDRN